MKEKIEQVESQLAQKLDNPLKNILQELQYIVPRNYRPCASFLDSNGRKKRSDASAENWSPESGRIEIRFEPAPGNWKAEMAESFPANVDSPTSSGTAEEVSRADSASDYSVNPEVNLLKALARAESKPGWNFVSLKKFRDEVLPAEPFPPQAAKLTDVEWENILRRVIDKRLVLVGKVANPKSPQFPVTTIRLNRLMPEVQAVLGQDKQDLDFHPIHIKGEPLSSTILRERR